MTHIAVEVDDELFNEASEALGSSSQEEVITWALQQALAACEQRREALRRLRSLVADGAIDVALLEDKRNYRPKPSE